MIRWLEKKRWLSILVVIILAGIIFYLSDSSSPPSPGGDFWPIAYHIVIFFLLAIFLFASVKGRNRIKAWHVLLILLLCVLYAFSDEWHQSFIAGRHAGIVDVMYDTTGIFLAVFLYSLKSSRHKFSKVEQMAYQEDVKKSIS